MKHLSPIQIKADNAGMLFRLVMDEIKKGSDLYAPPFVAFTGQICQYMAPGLCLYQYELIEANDLADLDDKVQALAALGFDFMFSTVMWNGGYLQWMQRMNEAGESVKEVLTESLQITTESDVSRNSVVVELSPVYGTLLIRDDAIRVVKELRDWWSAWTVAN